MAAPTVAHQATALLGEGPVWEPRRQALLWVDVERSQVHLSGVEGTRSHLAPEPVGAVAPSGDGRVLLAMGTGFAILDLDDGGIEVVARIPGADPARVRMNDGKVDPAGRFWAGTKAYDDEPGAGGLYRLDGPGQVTEVLPEVTISNGLGWSPDGGTFYYIDTPTQTVRRFPFDPATGSLGAGEIHVDTGGLSGWPDGMTIDAQGDLWVAFWDGWAVRCFSGRDGALLRQLEVPVARPTSCAFGGAGLRRLFVTTARTGLTADAAGQQPLAGSVLAFEPGVAGLPATPAALPE